MTQADVTRALIRQLYFVDRLPLAVIAAELSLTERVVRRALVISPDDPDPTPTPATPASRRRTKGA